MLIVGDESQHRGFPWLTLLLVATNIAAYAVQVYSGDPVTYGYGLVPQEIMQGEDIAGGTLVTIYERVSDGYGHVRSEPRSIVIPHEPGPRPIYLTLLTHMFLHINLMHLIGNMCYLLVFGRNVERAMGPLLFLFFYLQCGVAAGLTHVFLSPDSVIPLLGASGAISGVMGAYFFILPFNWVKVWLFFCIIDVPSFVVLGGWALVQYLATLEAFQTGTINTGIAYWAHFGGFVAGITVVFILFTTLSVLTAASKKE
jgi:membrane associated rhomboid family serine protease